MLARIGVVVVAFSIGGACATTSPIPSSGSAGSNLQLEERGGDDAKRVFPERIGKARLDKVDRFAYRVWSEHNGAVSTEVRLCVRPNGSTESVNLLSTSGMLDYDIQVVEGVAQWRYEPFHAPA